RAVVGVQGDSSPSRAPIEALGELYRSSYHRYLRLAEAITGDVDVAHEAVQDAFARAIRGRFEDRGTGSLEGWVWRTVVNTARNARRDLPPSSLPLDEVAGASASRNGDLPGDGVRAVIAALPE